MENSERLGRQARPGIKSVTSHLPVLKRVCKFSHPGFEPGTFGASQASLATRPLGRLEQRKYV